MRLPQGQPHLHSREKPLKLVMFYQKPAQQTLQGIRINVPNLAKTPKLHSAKAHQTARSATSNQGLATFLSFLKPSARSYQERARPFLTLPTLQKAPAYLDSTVHLLPHHSTYLPSHSRVRSRICQPCCTVRSRGF